MAIENAKTAIPGVTAAADLTTHQHKFVEITAAHAVNLSGAAGVISGVLVNKPNTGDGATVLGAGSVAKVVASASILAGARVGSAANGEARTAVTGDFVAGEALNAVGAQGELVSVNLNFPGREP